MNEHRKLLIGVSAGVVLGAGTRAVGEGTAWHRFVLDNLAQPAGQVFLRLLFMLVIPMLFSAIVVGLAGLDLRGLGRIGLRTLGYTVVVSGIAVVLGMGLVNLVRPGEGLSPELREQARGLAQVQALPKSPDTRAVTQLVQMVPDNPIKAAANGDMLGLIAFSVLFGVALSLTRGAAVARLKETIEGLYEVSMTLIGGVLKLAPLGVGALLFNMVGRLGLELLQPLLSYVLVVLLALATHQFVVYSLSVRFLGGLSPLAFFRAVRLAMVTAFATASSSATLPTALKVAEENLKLPQHVGRFVLTAGSAMNQNGTALFEGVTVLFLAQLFGVDLTVGQQLVVMVVCILGGIGTAGVPAGSLPVIAMILGMVGVPPEALGLVLGVDRFLDMCRTTVNVTGDLAAAVYVSRGEPVELPQPAVPAAS